MLGGEPYRYIRVRVLTDIKFPHSTSTIIIFKKYLAEP